MDVRLIVEQGKTRVREVRLRHARTVVGRAKGCDLRIPAAEVSRRHCLIERTDTTVTVEDLDSANGTLVNGRPVRGQQTVEPGDRLTVGPVTFVVEFTAPVLPAAPDRLDVLPEPDALPLAALADEDEPVPLAAAVEDDDQPLPVDDEDCLPTFDDDGSGSPDGWRLPTDDSEVRDLLEALEDEDEPPPGPKKKR